MQNIQFSPQHFLSEVYRNPLAPRSTFRSLGLLLLLSLPLAIPLNRLSAQCTVSFTNCPEQPIRLFDCDHNGQVTLDWPDLIANPSGGCTEFSLMQTAGPLRGMEAPFGVFNISYLAQANSLGEGSPATALCNFLVEVLPDVQPPVFTFCPPDITIYAGANNQGQTQWPLPTCSDNCGGQILLGSNINCGDVLPMGDHTVVYTATDASGNIATCSFRVTVIGSHDRGGNAFITKMKTLARAGIQQVDAVLKTQDMNAMSIALLPNPFRESLSLSANSAPSAPLAVQVYDLTGRLTTTGVWPEGSALFQLPTAEWVPGVYLIKVGNESSSRPQVFMGVKL